MARIWTSFVVAVVLFAAVIVVGGTLRGANPECVSCGAQVALTLWLIGMAAHQPIVWSPARVTRGRAYATWLAAAASGIAAYIGVEAVAAGWLAASGRVDVALSLATGANVLGVVAAAMVSSALMRRAASDAAASRPRTGGWVVVPIAALIVIGGAAAFARVKSAPMVTDIPATTPNSYLETLRESEQGLQEHPPDVVVQLATLLAEYEENEFAAAARYETPKADRLNCFLYKRCRVVEVTATVEDMRRDDNDAAHLTLASDGRRVSAFFVGPPQEALRTIKRGSQVTLRCMAESGAPVTFRLCGIP